MPRTYLTLAEVAESTYEEKRSQFIAQLWPVKSKEEGVELLSAARTAHPGANHICTAYVLGNPQQAQAAGYSDDGEPGGTAGRPMLNLLIQHGVGDVFALVVRYFGGVKLGTGGLARAYRQSVSGALDGAKLIEVVPSARLHARVDFAQEERVRHILQQLAIVAIEAEYSTDVRLSFECPEHRLHEVKSRLLEATGGSARVLEPK